MRRGEEPPEELHRLGVAALNAGDFTDAREMFRRAQSLADDPNLLARIESSLAFLAADESDLDQALDRLDRALKGVGLSPGTRGALLQQRATSPRRKSDSLQRTI